MFAKETVAVIDVGSNSIKLLVAQRGSEDLYLEKLFSKTLETRISAGISHKNHELNEAAMHIGCQSIAVLVHLAKAYEPTIIKIVATSAVRDARNAEQFIDRVYRETAGFYHWLPPLRGLEGMFLVAQEAYTRAQVITRPLPRGMPLSIVNRCTEACELQITGILLDLAVDINGTLE